MTLKQQLDRIWETGYCLNPLEKTQWEFINPFEWAKPYLACKNLYEQYFRSGSLNSPNL